ncbi:GNAT family N-acetyltransferase [Janthinobacterium sp. 17J80-10]|uniref:GNAT family N-acetyltransferase n=1 Tax=Janthinobacterium sp. 17J80-10 TaxID=2497863 RepID=UPI0010057218|nr:GNAT family N-acetyltransferase [Janthinobacterium sp. 17J80-10]QAU35147.1 GNAT family N-acetyltransferase [Janthinobacterium sp. 17J80-10]
MAHYVAPLDQTHDVKGFDCGTEKLNTWLQTIAGQHQSKGLSKTFVLVEDEAPTIIIGFYALAIRRMTPKEALPAELARKLPSDIPGYTLARLAIATSAAGQGFGAELLIDAMRRAKQVSNQVGGSFLFVDAKDQRAADFYSHFGFVPLPDDPLTLVMPMSAIEDD